MTSSTGIVPLPSFHGLGSRADGVSADGSVVVGQVEYEAGGPVAFRWTSADGFSQPYCNAEANSTSCFGRLNASGSPLVGANSLALSATKLPANAFGFFLTSRDQGSTFPVNNSQGRLCLGGFIGRYVGPGQIKNSGAAGTFSLAIDLTSMPQPFGSAAVQPGETWNFQAWHRDANPALTSNFTDAVSVMFQ
ncbi:MAG: hypothetical protein R3F49_25200 [Planctomycetota bacterium]